MRISPINNNTSKLNFRGEYSYMGAEQDLEKSPLWHKNSTKDVTLGSHHIDRKYKAYFASPLEKISDAIKDKVDYVVYDNEPAYPAIEEVGLNYFNEYRRNFGEEFEDLRQYYYRREMGGFADVQHAKEEQRKAANCVGLYNEGGHLRYEKEKAEDEIACLKVIIARKIEGITDTQKEIKAQQKLKADAEGQIENLGKILKAYQDVKKATTEAAEPEKALLMSVEKKIADSKKTEYVSRGVKEYGIFHKTKANFATIELKKGELFSAAKQQVENYSKVIQIQSTIDLYKSVKEGAAKLITSMEAHVKKLSNEVEKSNGDIITKEAYIQECKAKLIPIFDKLKNYYAEKGIQGVRKLV